MADTILHLETYSPEAKSLVASAQSLADQRKHATVDPSHLLFKILEQNEIVPIFRKLGVDIQAMVTMLEAEFDKLVKSDKESYLSTAMQKLLENAEKDAKGGTVGVDNLLNALAQEIRGSAAKIIQEFNIAPGSFRPYNNTLKQVAVSKVNNSTFSKDLIDRARSGAYGPIIGRDAEVRRLLQVLARSTKNNPLLVGQSGCGKSAIVQEIAKRFEKGEVPDNLLNMEFVELDISALTSGTKVRGEVEDRIKYLVNSFINKSKNAIILIDGLENLFNQSSMLNVADTVKAFLLRDEVRILGTTNPEGLRKLTEKDAAFVRRFTQLNIEPPTTEQAIEILRGISSRFEAYHKVKITEKAITSAVNLAKRYVQNKALPDSAVDLLDESSARKRVEITGMPAELDKDIRRLESLKTQLPRLENDEDPKSKKLLEVVKKEIAEIEPKVNELRSNIETRRNTIITLNNLRAEHETVKKDIEQARSIKDYARLGQLEHETLPNLERKLQEAESNFEKGGYIDVSNVVGEQEVAQVVGDWTGIPMSKMLENETEKLLKMEDRITARVVGQEEAVAALSKAIRRSRVGLRDPRKPIGSFMFLGASGCGKTELAKALAEFLFDDEQAMTRMDCSEMMEKHMAQRLIGSPIGYQGSEEGGMLTNAVFRRPYSVLLFDEIEKAHKDVFNMLLQVLDDGRLTDGRGKTADFSNTVVILTSNIGSKRLLDANPEQFETKEGLEGLREEMLTDMKDFLRPEFINRVDNILLFKPLTKESLNGIADLELRKVEKLVAEREFKLALTPEAKKELVDISYVPAFGARPLKRSITDQIQNPLAEAILHKGYKDGSTITVDVNSNKEFIFV